MLHQVRLCIRVKDIPTLVPSFGSCACSNPKFPSGGPGHPLPCRVWGCTHGNPKFRSGPVVSCRVRVPVQTRSGGSGGLAQGRSGRVVTCVGARAHVAVPKMLSRDRPCVFCTFVWPVCPMLPRAFVRVVRPRKPQNFVRVVRPWKPQISFGRVGTCRVWVPVQTGGSGRSRVFVSTRPGGSFEDVRVNSFGRGRTRADEPVSKMLSCDPRLALCTFVQLVCPALPCPFVSVVRAPM